MTVERTEQPPTSAEAEASKPRKPKKFIKSTVSIHDRTQIETVFDYYLMRGKEPQQAKQLTYRVEAFIFYPRQFGLDPQTYPKERFYNDVRPLIRFREPRLSYKQLLGIKPDVESPLVSLGRFIEAGQNGEPGLDAKLAVDEVRLFACSLIGNFMRNLDRRRKRFQALRAAEGGAAPEDVAKAVRRMQLIIHKLELVLTEYRSLIGKAGLLPEALRKPLQHEMRLADEYFYYRLSDGLTQMLVLGTELGRACGEDQTRALLTEVQQLLERENAHADQHGYIRIAADSSTALKERFVHRRGELKRRIWQVLFLQIRTTPLFTFQQQMGAMIAAGLAACWAVTAQILFLNQATTPQGISTSGLLSTGGIVLITAGVLAYVIKDRIKEFGRSYFRGRLFRTLPDQSEVIYYEDQPVGRNREAAKFLSLAQLPEDVGAVRETAIAKAFENEEDVDGVLHYTKDICLSRSIRILGRYPLKAVHDILRINIDSCLPRLGEPTRVHQVVSEGCHVQPVLLPKVYYLDMALRYSKLGRQGQKLQERADYFRLVIDKNGLLRIDRLAEAKAENGVS